jgi:hypothetical protein
MCFVNGKPKSKVLFDGKGQVHNVSRGIEGKDEDTASVIGLKYRIENYDCIEIFRCVILSA